MALFPPGATRAQRVTFPRASELGAWSVQLAVRVLTVSSAQPRGTPAALTSGEPPSQPDSVLHPRLHAPSLLLCPALAPCWDPRSVGESSAVQHGGCPMPRTPWALPAHVTSAVAAWPAEPPSNVRSPRGEGWETRCVPLTHRPNPAAPNGSLRSQRPRPCGSRVRRRLRVPSPPTAMAQAGTQRLGGHTGLPFGLQTGPIWRGRLGGLRKAASPKGARATGRGSAEWWAWKPHAVRLRGEFRE